MLRSVIGYGASARTASQAENELLLQSGSPLATAVSMYRQGVDDRRDRRRHSGRIKVSTASIAARRAPSRVGDEHDAAATATIRGIVPTGCVRKIKGEFLPLKRADRHRTCFTGTVEDVLHVRHMPSAASCRAHTPVVQRLGNAAKVRLAFEGHLLALVEGLHRRPLHLRNMDEDIGATSHLNLGPSTQRIPLALERPNSWSLAAEDTLTPVKRAP